MKSCAKKNGVSTAELLDMVNCRKGAGTSAGPKKQADLKDILRQSDGDFKMAPPPALPAKRTRKRKKLATDELVG